MQFAIFVLPVACRANYICKENFSTPPDRPYPPLPKVCTPFFFFFGEKEVVSSSRSDWDRALLLGSYVIPGFEKAS